MKKYFIASSIAFLALVSVTAAQEYTFSKDLTVGFSGADVTALQSWLISNGFDIPAVSSGAAARGYFGSQTREAVRRFQESEGLPMTGYFGRMSRGRIHDRWGNRPTDSRSPVINGVDAPTVLNVGETGTWTIRATDPQNGSLSYSIDWGENLNYMMSACPAGYSCTPNAGVASAPTVQQGSTFTHSYSEARTYKVTFIVRNSLGLSAQSTATVKVANSNVSPLNIISPNGGEVWTKGTTQNIRWNAPAYFRATYADITLVPYYQQCTGQVCPMGAQTSGAQTSMMYPYHAPYPIAKNISINQNSFSWKVGDYIPEVMTMIYPPVYPTVPDGQYTIQICETGTNNCDSSDRPFTIKSNSIPQVTSPNGGEVWMANSSQYLRWSIPTGMDTMTRVDLYLDAGAPCSTMVTGGPTYFCLPIYTLDKNIPITMAYNWLVATDINNAKIPAGNYSFRVCVAGSTTNCDSSDKPFTISSPTSQTIKVTSPNGGEGWTANSTHQISWSVTGATDNKTKVDLYLIRNVTCQTGSTCTPSPYVLDKNVAYNSIYNWIVATDVDNNPILQGQFKVSVCLAGTNNCDTSDSVFTIQPTVYPTN